MPFGEDSHGTEQSSPPVPVLRYPSIASSLDFLITTFQCCSFQIPDHPANSLITTYKSMQICTYDHLFPDRVENQIHHSKFLPLKDFPSVFSLRPSVSGVLTVQTSILIWCQHFKHNHLETRPIIFLPPLSGHKKLPQRGISVN